MVTTFSKIVEMMEKGAVPAWLRNYIVANRREIADAIAKNGAFEIKTPDGDTIRVSAERREVAA